MRTESEVLALLCVIADTASYYADTLQELNDDELEDYGYSKAEYNEMITDIACMANYMALRIDEPREEYILVPDEFQKWLNRDDSEFDRYFDTI